MRAAQAVHGARRARARARFVNVMARQLQEIAPGTVRVRTVPITMNDRPRTWVALLDLSGCAMTTTTAAESRAVFGLLCRAFPEADWSCPRTYTAATGDLTVDPLTPPFGLGIAANTAISW
ncbi:MULTISPECIES: hypothetical protein [unclassified Streptomyces]|uniref:hypothetical protein n=1 Tax=unclassified Streptomyces TaxID=2593676 RepID=UPI001CB6E043|nr:MULTISPECIES: hypothetical protein [unclassified Streptomyces]